MGELAAEVDPLDPRSWLAAARAIAAYTPDLLVVSWWATTPWIVCWHFVARQVRRRSPSTRVVYWCHDVRPRSQHRAYLAVTARALRPADAFIVHAAHQADELRKMRPGATVLTTPLPSLDMFAGQRLPAAAARRRLGIAEGARVALFFGIVSPYKGLDDLLDALPAARQAVPDLHLLVVGRFEGGSDAYRARVQRLALSGVVTMVDGYVPDADVALYFSAADVVVLPYREATQSGVAALACGFGVPVIATDVGGLGEAVADGIDGLLVPPGRPDALAQAIARYFTDGLAAPLAAGLRDRQPALSPDRMVERLVGYAAAPLARA